MTEYRVVRSYDVTLPDGWEVSRHVPGSLLDAMLEDDSEVKTAAGDDPSMAWLKERLLIWLTYQYDMGDYTDLVSLNQEYADDEPLEVEPPTEREQWLIDVSKNMKENDDG